ncbi:MAG: hypothetical protein OEZ01_00155 [Candidatus Heimdallarchaeota archaeon]|nr:hypothetical protein [Candidatus Heimdallarchaeota archaeon]
MTDDVFTFGNKVEFKSNSIKNDSEKLTKSKIMQFTESDFSLLKVEWKKTEYDNFSSYIRYLIFEGLKSTKSTNSTHSSPQ